MVLSRMTINFKLFSQLVLASGSLLIAQNFHNNYSKPKVKVSKQDSTYNLNNNIGLFFSLGQKRIISDLLWIATLLEGDLEHYKKRDLNSWMFLRFKSVITYDPLFYNAYEFGGKYLSIIKDDLTGADHIYSEADKYFKDDYDINFAASYLYAFELKDYNKAISRLERIKDNPRLPSYYKTLILKIKSQLNISLEEIYTSLLELYKIEKKKTESTNILIEKIAFELYSVKAMIDLKCLNQKKQDCEKLDFDGNPYIFKKGKFRTIKPFKKFKLHHKKRQQ